MTNANANSKGIAFLILAILIISLQNIAIKGIGGSYPVLEMVVLRNLVALPFTLLFWRFEGKRGLPVSRRVGLQLFRGLCLFLSYTTYMMGLVALPLAEVESIRFSGPIMITFLSVVVLGEKVDFRRWLVLIIGFSGVLLIVRPGSSAFNPGSIFIVISMFLYALVILTTRKLQGTDSSATMAFYSSLVYLAAAVIIAPVTIAVGEMPNTHPSLAFLFRSWSVPTFLDGFIMGGLGLVWAGWTYFIARAYSLAQASVAAPFEYLSLPINIIWGFLLWREIPMMLTVAGAGLTLFSGLVILYMDRKEQQKRSESA